MQVKQSPLDTPYKRGGHLRLVLAVVEQLNNRDRGVTESSTCKQFKSLKPVEICSLASLALPVAGACEPPGSMRPKVVVWLFFVSSSGVVCGPDGFVPSAKLMKHLWSVMVNGAQADTVGHLLNEFIECAMTEARSSSHPLVEGCNESSCCR